MEKHIHFQMNINILGTGMRNFIGSVLNYMGGAGVTRMPTEPDYDCKCKSIEHTIYLHKIEYEVTSALVHWDNWHTTIE